MVSEIRVVHNQYNPEVSWIEVSISQRGAQNMVVKYPKKLKPTFDARIVLPDENNVLDAEPSCQKHWF